MLLSLEKGKSSLSRTILRSNLDVLRGSAMTKNFLMQFEQESRCTKLTQCASMGWKLGPVPLKKANPKLYALAKARVLALGYGAGWAKFIFMAKMYGAGECLLEPITEKQKQSFLKYIARTKQQEKIKISRRTKTGPKLSMLGLL
jgi:hypothetical protein